MRIKEMLHCFRA